MWLAMLMLAAMASGSACPDYCQCRAPKIECRGLAAKLSEFDELPANFTELAIRSLHDDELSRLNMTFFQRWQSVEVTNSSCTLNNEVLALLIARIIISRKFTPNFQVFNISHNCLERMPVNFYVQRVESLHVLDVSNNKIRMLVHTFESASDLTWLSFANNELTYIDQNYFKNLKLLEHLDLSNNALMSLEGNFDSLVSLQRLYLAGNKLHFIGSAWFQNLSKLVELDISRNKLTFIRSDSLQPLASLSVFKLAENPLIERDFSLLLGTGIRLEIVDASRIGLLRVPAALTHSVRILKLAGNLLTSINSGDLDTYPLLRVLDLTDNRLVIIEDDALGRLDNLEELILAGNILPTIPKSLPSSLKILDLRQNAISNLKANDLQELCSLEELILSGNVIEIIEGGIFRQLPALKVLDISDNPIKKLQSDTLNGPSNLMTLRMSGLMSLKTEENQNQDTAFPFLTPESLVKLDVSRSSALAAQLLADNAALSACKSLQELDLSYTNISSIRSDLAYVLPQLQKLNLIGNAWNCSEDQFWLGEWIRQHKDSAEFSTRCGAPSNFEGKLLQELPNLVSSQMNTTKVIGKKTNAPTLKSIKTKNSTSTYKTVNKTKSRKKQASSYALSSSTPKTVTRMYNTRRRLSSTTGIPKIMRDLTSQFTTSTTHYPLKIESLLKENTTEVNEPQTPLPTRQEFQKLITVNNNEKSPNPSTASNSEEYTSKAEILESTIPSTHETAQILIKNNRNKQLETTETSLITHPTAVRKKKVAKNISVTTPISRDTEETTTAVTTTTTTNVPTTVPSTSITADSTATTTTTSTTTIKELFTKRKQPAVIKLKENVSEKHRKEVKEDVAIDEKKPDKQEFSEFSHSKLLFANEEAHMNDEPNGFAEELNSQATESGARTSESLASGAHPGMLVLLGAAIGAAAALTVVLSRRATVNRRDRQYQRHENIEVHALTPTTELW